MTERMVHFFEEAGAENTDRVIEAVKQRIRQKDVGKVLVASESGRLALRVRDEIPPSVSVICVTYNRQTRTRYQKPLLMKQRLQKAGVAVVDTVREPMGRRLVFRNWFERKTLQLPGTHADLFWMTLICVGGHGLRTAVEIVFSARALEVTARNTGEFVSQFCHLFRRQRECTENRIEDVSGQVLLKPDVLLLIVSRGLLP